MDCEEIIKQYENNGIPYQGRCDDIRSIISNISSHLPKNDKKTNDILINSYSIYKMIEEIKIESNFCSIKFIDEKKKKIAFKAYYFGEKYEEMLDKTQYKLNGRCHSATLEYLKMNAHNNICAVTSICLNINNMFYFHSYIWDKDTNMIIDLSRNIVMNKEDYDYLFTYKEINVLSYKEFEEYIKQYENNYYNHLLYLALITLSEEKKHNKQLTLKITREQQVV